MYNETTEFNDSDIRLEDEPGFGEAYSDYKGMGYESAQSRAARYTMADCLALGYPIEYAKDYTAPAPASADTSDVARQLQEMRELRADIAELVSQLAHKETKELKEVKKKRKLVRISEEELTYCLTLRDEGVSYHDIAKALYNRFGVSRNSQAIRTYVSRYLAG